MAKVADFYLGATHVEFYDDYVITDPVKLAQIQQNLNEWATRVHIANARRELEKKKADEIKKARP